MRIQHNIMAMSAYRNYTNNVSAMKANLEKLSSGYKINRAGDDAAGLAISEKMRAQITGLETAQKNAKDGISLVQTAEGALTEVHDMLNRMVELATQSANGTYDNETDRYQLQKEMDQLRNEINRIADSSNFNGINLLDGSMAVVKESALTNVSLTCVLDGQMAGPDAQTGIFTLDLSQMKLTNSGTTDATSVTVEFAGKSLSLTLSITSAGGTAEGSDVATAFANAWNAAKTANKLDGVEYTATASGGVVTFKGDIAPTATPTDTYKFEYKDTNVATNQGEEIAVNFQQQPIAAGDGRLYGQAEFALSNIADGKVLQIGDESYIFAVGSNSKYANATGAKVVDLTDMEATADATKLAQTAAARLSAVATGNSRFYVGTDLTGTNIRITEKEGGVDYAVNNLYGTSNSTADGDWTGLVKQGTAASTGLTLQIGDTAASYNQLMVSISDCHTSAMGIADIDISTQAGAQSAIDAIKSAINYVSDVRGTLGATQNRLDHTINNLAVMTENIQDAESTIRDVDVAEEMMAYTKNNILIQASQAMLAQANQVPQGVLQLLQ